MPYGQVARAIVGKLLIFAGLLLQPRKDNEQQDLLDCHQDQNSAEDHSWESSKHLHQLNENIRSFVQQSAAHHQENKTSGDDALRWSKRATVFVILTTVISLGAVGAASWQAYVSSDTEKRQLRAYMFRSETDFVRPAYPVPPDGVYMSVGANFKNGGETPAYHTEIKMWLTALAYPLITKQIYEVIDNKVPAQGVNNSTIIFKDDQIGIVARSQVKYPPALVDAILRGSSVRLYAFGELTWQDTFKRPHWFHFCYILGGPENAPGAAASVERLDYCQTYNDAD